MHPTCGGRSPDIDCNRKPITSAASDVYQVLLTAITCRHSGAMTAAQLSIAFFLQMACIIAVCRVVGWAAHRYLLQPQVVGEMIAGVLLGPSVLG